jgi:hypothetical protein
MIQRRRIFALGPNQDPFSAEVLMPKRPGRRTWGSGSITWLSPSRARLRVRGEDGTRHSKTVRVVHRDHGGRGQAEAALDALLDEIEVGSSSGVRVARRPFAEVFSAYIDICRTNAKAGTIESYEHILRRLPEPLKAMHVEEITAHYLDSLYASMRDQGYAPSTVRQTHAVVHTVFTQAYRWNWIATNPAGATRPIRDTTPEKRVPPRSVPAHGRRRRPQGARR